MCAPHYNVYWDQIYYHFSIEGDPIHSSSLLKKSQQLYEKQNKDIRPILIFNFNPSSSVLILDDAASYEKGKVGEKFEFSNITVHAKQPYTIYILNHKFNPLSDIRICIFSQTSAPKSELQAKMDEDSNSVLNEILEQIENSIVDVKKFV